jgi:hypothetical protein
MTVQDNQNRLNDKEDLIELMQTVVGRDIPGVREVIKLLSHPAVIEETNRYFSVLNPATMCLNYQAPWNCAREGDARYENMQFGWVGGANGIGYSEWWCENCRKKAMGE